jgi:hypothetical protein
VSELAELASFDEFLTTGRSDPNWDSAEQRAKLSMETHLGIADAPADDVYAAMDWLVAMQDVIEAKLAARHLSPEPKPGADGAGPLLVDHRAARPAIKRSWPTTGRSSCSCSTSKISPRSPARISLASGWSPAQPRAGRRPRPPAARPGPVDEAGEQLLGRLQLGNRTDCGR